MKEMIEVDTYDCMGRNNSAMATIMIDKIIFVKEGSGDRQIKSLIYFDDGHSVGCWATRLEIIEKIKKSESK